MKNKKIENIVKKAYQPHNVPTENNSVHFNNLNNSIISLIIVVGMIKNTVGIRWNTFLVGWYGWNNKSWFQLCFSLSKNLHFNYLTTSVGTLCNWNAKNTYTHTKSKKSWTTKTNYLCS